MDLSFLDIDETEIPQFDTDETVADAAEAEAERLVNTVADLKEEVSDDPLFNIEPVTVREDGRIVMKVALKRMHYEWLVNSHRTIFPDRLPSNLVERLIREAYSKDSTKGGQLPGTYTFLKESANVIEGQAGISHTMPHIQPS